MCVWISFHGSVLSEMEQAGYTLTQITVAAFDSDCCDCHLILSKTCPIHAPVLGGSLPTCLHYLWIPKPFAHWYKCATKISLKTLKPPQLAPFIMEKQPQYAEQLPKEHREVLRLEKEAHLVCLWSHFGPLSNFVFLCLCLENKNQFYLLMRICCQR